MSSKKKMSPKEEVTENNQTMSHKEKDGKLWASFAFWFNLLVVYIPKDIWRYFMLKEKDVKGKTVVITGGASGIGQRMAEIFALDKGANVAILDVDLAKAQETAGLICKQGGNVAAFQCDVTSPKNLEDCASQIRATFKQVDIVICNAGILYFGFLMELTQEQVRKAVDVNFLGVFNTIRAFLPDFESRNEGQIVSMSSICGHFGETLGAAYCPVKFAVNGLMECVKNEMTDRGLNGIKCTTLSPFFVRTPMILDIGMRPTSRFIPFMSINRCASSSVEAILNEEVHRYIPKYIAIMTMAKYLMGYNFTNQARRYMNCRYIPTKLAPTVQPTNKTSMTSSSSESGISADLEDVVLEPAKPYVPERKLLPPPEANNFFEGPYILGSVITGALVFVGLVILLSPNVFNIPELGKAGHMVYLLGTKYSWMVSAIFYIVMIAHFFEGIHALYLCEDLDMSQSCAARWFVQTLFIGAPSLTKLKHHYTKVKECKK